MPINEEEHVTAINVAKQLKTSARTVQRLHKSGVLRGVRFGARKLKFRPSAVAQALLLSEESGPADPKSFRELCILYQST